MLVSLDGHELSEEFLKAYLPPSKDYTNLKLAFDALHVKLTDNRHINVWRSSGQESNMSYMWHYDENCKALQSGIHMYSLTEINIFFTNLGVSCPSCAFPTKVGAHTFLSMLAQFKRIAEGMLRENRGSAVAVCHSSLSSVLTLEDELLSFSAAFDALEEMRTFLHLLRSDLLDLGVYFARRDQELSPHANMCVVSFKEWYARNRGGAMPLHTLFRGLWMVSGDYWFTRIPPSEEGSYEGKESNYLSGQEFTPAQLDVFLTLYKDGLTVKEAEATARSL